MLITSFYCVAGKQYFYAKICSQKRATLAMQQDDGTARPRDHGTTRLRDCGTTRLRDNGTARLRDNETARLRDYETTGLRDYETTRLRDYETTEQQKNRKTQAFSGVLRHSQSCVACAITTLPSEMNFCQKGLDVALSRKMAGWGCTWAYIPIQADEGSAADSLLSQKLLGVRRAPSATLGKNAVDG